MSFVDHNFLLYLLDKYKPKKILEIGVAAGGTSCMLLKNTGPSQQVWGVDISDKYYRNPSLSAGYLIKQECSSEEMQRHTLILGKDIVDCIDEIGPGIDFCLLDTNHVLPGELLQFFVVYPYLKKGACLAMHDISLNFYPEPGFKVNAGSYASFSNKILFCSLGSKCKMLPDQDWPNIGAVIMDEETKRCIDVTFFALGVTWHYYPAWLIDKYRDFIAAHYDSFCVRIFDQCIKNQPKLTEFYKQNFKAGY